MNFSNTPPSLIVAINERHLSKVDKFFRMSHGASSSLSDLGETSFLLEIKIDCRVKEKSASQLIWNIVQSWRLNPEIKHCTTCVVYLHRSPGPTGFMLTGKERWTDKREIAARVREIRRTSKLPAPLVAKYFLSFTPIEGMFKVQERSPAENET
jgi:hypothetical protein